LPPAMTSAITKLLNIIVPTETPLVLTVPAVSASVKLAMICRPGSRVIGVSRIVSRSWVAATKMT